MDFIKHLEQLKAQLINEKENKIAIIKQQVAIQCEPKYQEIERIKAEELSKLALTKNTDKSILDEQYSNQLTALEQRYENSKKFFEESCVKRKSEIFNEALEKEIFNIKKEYDNAIADIDGLIKKRPIKE